MNYKKINQIPSCPPRTHVPLMNPSLVAKSFNLGYNSAVFPNVVGKYPTESTAYYLKDIQNCGYQFYERKCT
jgi:hypothetical protein